MYTKKKIFSIIFKDFLFFLLVAVGFSATVGLAYGQQNSNELKSSSDFIKVIKYYRYLNPDSAVFFVELGLKKAIKDNDEGGQAALLNQYGMIDDNAGRYQESRQKYLQAEAIYRKEKNDEGLSATLVRLGVVEKRKGNLDKALAYYMKALKINENTNNKMGLLEVRVVLSEAYFTLEDYENCLKNLEIAEKLNSKLPSSNLSLNMYITFGYFFIKINRYDKAISYINTGLSKSNKVEYNGSKIGLLNLLGMAYHKKGEKAKAVASFKKALSFAREINNVLREQSTLADLAEVYEKESPDTALKYLNEALMIVTKHKIYRQEIIILNRMSEMYVRKGDFEMAYSLSRKSYVLSDEVYFKDMSKQISNLETAYELEKSNAQLIELQLRSNKETMVKNVFLSIAVALTLLFVLALLYYYKANQLNKLLQQANQKLAESNEEKDKFFSIVAHDIRSPLASAIGVLRLIADRELDEQTQDKVVNKLALHCESSLEILDKLLRWGQMQIKGARINITEFEPLQNIKANVAILKEASESKNITIAVDIPENLIVKADSDHFEFLVRNLLANAIKFTPVNGLISLSAVMQSKDVVCFKVADNGVGISQNRIKKLFELSAIGTKGTSEEEGTSLGLLICKEFIVANDGELSVESEIGKGTTFTFTLPGAIEELAEV